MSTMTSEREAFEKWVSEQPWFLATLYLARSGDEYADPCINSRWQGWKAHHLAQPAQAVDVGADFHTMNRALCDFAMRWQIDGDYMRCRKCNRPQITNYASHDFLHSADCKAAGEVETRPWETFARLLSPLTRALSGEKAGWRLVPEIATPAMIDAGRAARPDGQFTGQCGEVYRAMLAASPTPDKE